MQAQITDLENQGVNNAKGTRNSPTKRNEHNKSLESLGQRLDGLHDQIEDVKERCRQLDKASNISARSSSIQNELIGNSNQRVGSGSKKRGRIQSGKKSAGRPASALSKASKKSKAEKPEKK